MPRVTVNKNEPIDKALRRFKKRCIKEGLIKEIRRRRHYVKPSERRRIQFNKGKKRSRSGR